MALDGDFNRQSLSDLRDTFRLAVRTHSGWPPFVNLGRAPYTPKPVDGAIECWVGPDNDGSYDRPAHHDWAKLAGRVLVSHGNPNRTMFNGYRSSQDRYEVTETIPVASLPDALPELVFSMLTPLYELFDFFRLPKRLVEEELFSMHRNTFSR